jgi:Rod binding domain-containing protein
MGANGAIGEIEASGVNEVNGNLGMLAIGAASANDSIPGRALLGNAQAAATPSPKLVHAAHEFEAQMMKELLKPMTESDPLTGDEKGADGVLDSGAGSGGTLGEFATESLGKALSDRGGFGIADRIVNQLTHSGNHGVTGTVTGELHGNTVISRNK